MQDREELASSAMDSNAFYLFAIKEFAKLHGTLHELRATQGDKRHGASVREQARSPRPQVRGNPLGLSEEAQRVVNAAAGAQLAGGVQKAKAAGGGGARAVGASISGSAKAVRMMKAALANLHHLFFVEMM